MIEEKEVYKDFRTSVRTFLEELRPESDFLECLEIMCDICAEEVNKEMHKLWPDVNGYSWEVY